MRRLINGFGLTLAVLVVLAITAPSVRVLAQNVACYLDQGGAGWHAGSGCTVTVESGGVLNVASGGALKIAGTTLSATAAQFNTIAGVTAGAASASKAVVLGANKNLDTLVLADGGLYLGSGAGTAVSATAAELNYTDVTAAGTAQASKAAVLGTAKNIDFLQFGAASPASAALMHGAGTSASPVATATPDKNFLGYWTSTTATSGDSRLMYLRQYFSGAGVSGETARIYATINDVSVASGGTINGAHISLSATGAAAAVSGAANVIRATLDYAASVGAIGGTVNVLRLDTNLASGPTIGAGTSFIAMDNLSTQKLDYMLNITNPSAAMFATAGSGASSCGLAGGMVAAKVLLIRVDGVDFWLPLCSSNGS